MGAHIVKSLFLSVVVGLIYGFALSFSIAFYTMLKENWTMILILAGVGYGYVWLTTKLLSKLSGKMHFMYWFLGFILSLITFILSLTKSIKLGEEEISFFSYFIFHFSLLLILIPEGDTYTQTYINFGTLYDLDDNEYDVAWISKEYVSGVTTKLTAVIVIALLASLAGTFLGTFGIWLPFIIEGGFSLVLFGINLKNVLS